MIIEKRKGFTLIELLVVIAIIAMLLAILLPSLRAAKKQAQAVVCRSNMCQIGLAVNLYAEDYQSYIPRGINSTGIYAWYNLFLPYLGKEYNDGDYRNVKIYRCLSYPDKNQTVCYVVNAMTDGIVEAKEPTKLNVFKHPQSTVYLADNEDGEWREIIENNGDVGTDRLDVFRVSHLPGSTIEVGIHGRRVASKRHKDGSNYLFLAGHVDYIATEDMSIRYWRER
ncbi:MAG: type II secretion system protein [Deltaproteobacteria bacterium]|nr:type II secretion system protein [Deltaproteobacteria bacterium]